MLPAKRGGGLIRLLNESKGVGAGPDAGCIRGPGIGGLLAEQQQSRVRKGPSLRGEKQYVTSIGWVHTSFSQLQAALVRYNVSHTMRMHPCCCNSKVTGCSYQHQIMPVSVFVSSPLHSWHLEGSAHTAAQLGASLSCTLAPHSQHWCKLDRFASDVLVGLLWRLPCALLQGASGHQLRLIRFLRR